MLADGARGALAASDRRYRLAAKRQPEHYAAAAAR